FSVCLQAIAAEDRGGVEAGRCGGDPGGERGAAGARVARPCAAVHLHGSAGSERAVRGVHGAARQRERRSDGVGGEGADGALLRAEAVSRRRKEALRFIVALGLVSLFADMTYEGARAIIGPYLQTLGASGFEMGLVVGLGEMCAASLRYWSGRMADRTRAYWAIAICGYTVNLLAVPMLAFAGNWFWAGALVVAERTGKALRGPARDVLLSEATAEVGHGWGFGLHTAMDQTGAVLGPLWVALAVAREHG